MMKYVLACDCAIIMVLLLRIAEFGYSGSVSLVQFPWFNFLYLVCKGSVYVYFLRMIIVRGFEEITISSEPLFSPRVSFPV